MSSIVCLPPGSTSGHAGVPMMSQLASNVRGFVLRDCGHYVAEETAGRIGALIDRHRIAN